MTKVLFFSLGAVLIFESSTSLATTPKLPPRHMTIGLLQLLCLKNGKSLNSSDQASLAYCQGYLSGVIDSYFEREIPKKSWCLLFPSNNLLRDEIRNEILAVSEQRALNLDYGLRAEPWIRARLAEKCKGKVQL